MRTHPIIPDVSTGFVPLPYLETHVADHLRHVLARHAGGARLPSERTMADQLAVSRPVVRAALARLATEGRISRRHGAVTTSLAAC